MTTTNKECYIDFSIDYNGDCECVDDFVVDDEIIQIDDEDVESLIEKLQGVEGFFQSEHRTQVRIWWNQDGTMDVRYRSYTEPDWDEFEDHELLGIPRIEFEFEF